jgi:DNA gyrase subunit B
MKRQLLELGLADVVFLPGGEREIAGDAIAHLCRTLAGLEESLVALERRGISLRQHAERQDAATGRLPMYHVLFGPSDRWFHSRDDLDKFLSAQQQAAGGSLSASLDPAAGPAPQAPAGQPPLGQAQPGAPVPPAAKVPPAAGKPAASGTASNGAAVPPQDGPPSDGQPSHLHIVELHEVRSLNSGLAELIRLGFDIQALIPQERTGSQEPRYRLRRGDSETGLEDLRGLLSAVRSAGERGLTITRFKGLGEMNAEELRDTTLDPAHRTLSQVTMDDLHAADDLFRILMGDKVEPRREFIERHALEVRNLDV